MAVPDFQTFMLPVLREFADGAEHVYKNVRERVAAALRLSPEDLADRIASGKKTRVGPSFPVDWEAVNALPPADL